MGMEKDDLEMIGICGLAFRWPFSQLPLPFFSQDSKSREKLQGTRGKRPHSVEEVGSLGGGAEQERKGGHCMGKEGYSPVKEASLIGGEEERQDY